MTGHPYRYSMVVDWAWAHPYQAEVLLFTLQEYGAVPREAITLQCTHRVSEEVRGAFRRQGYRVVGLAPYLDGTYCNKIAQLDCLVEEAAQDARLPPMREDTAGVFLLDLDMAVLAPLNIAEPDAICGKIVDGDNPDLATIEGIFAAAELSLPKVVPCDWADRGETIATNFNGGFVYVPQAQLAPLRRAWRRWAEFLFTRPQLFADDSRKHIDQVSFAMAVASTGAPYRQLPTNWNFPCHEQHELRYFNANDDLVALHVHDCLDEFGLLAPTISGYPAVNEAAKNLNAALGQRRASAFFNRFKRGRARQAVSRVPVTGHAMFSRRCIAQARLGDRKRRLILHAGTPKTGTSSLQRHLGSNRQQLASAGWWYPPPSDTPEPKHQQVNDLLQRGDEVGFAAYIEGALKAMPAHAHTIVLSTEGIFNHWWDYPPRSKGMLRQLAALFDFELCIWFRPPPQFAAALYAQYLRNPATADTPANVYGKDITFAEALNDPWFRRHLDYLGFYHEATGLFGQRVRAFLFGGDTVKAFIDAYDVPLPPRHRWRNTSLRSAGVELMRAANRFPLPASEHRQVAALVGQIDGVIGQRSQRFRLDDAQQRSVLRYAERGWAALQPVLTSTPAAPPHSARDGAAADGVAPKRKVFCIGFHKTGTTSLRRALQMLGYRVAGPSGAQDPDIADHALGMALALATTFDAFADNPWPILYQELDATFPDSQFILTTRATSAWIASVGRYFGAEETPMRNWIYGVASPHGNEARYVARYQQHNREVRRYFGGREDLLVMDLEAGDGWAELAAFLGQPAPDGEFPHVNRLDGQASAPRKPPTQK